MSVMDKLWDAFSAVVKMNDKVTGLAATTSAHQARIEDLTARVIRLETALEIAMSARVAANRRQLPRQTKSRPRRDPDN